MPGVLVERVLVGVADRLQQVVGLLGSEAADDGARDVVGDRDEQAGAGDRDSGEDERHRQVAERGADEQADVLADDRLDHREHQHQQRERAGDGDHGAVLALEPARREIGAGRALDELADLAGHPDRGVRDPGGDAAHDELACLGSDLGHGSGDRVADVADDGQLARSGDRESPSSGSGRSGSVRDASLGADVDRELALRLSRRAPVRGRRILVAELDPEGPVPALRGSAADEAVRGERETRREGAVEDPELVGESGAATAVSLELMEVARPDRPVWHLVAVVREPNRRGARHDDEGEQRDNQQGPGEATRTPGGKSSAQGSARSNSSKRGIAANSSPGA